jgi:phage gp45-like
MRHSNSRTSADRHASGISRAVVEEVDDTKLMQEHKHSLAGDEQQAQNEHAHPYGFVNVPQKPTGTGKMRMAAEAFMSFMGAGRSHGIAMLVGDRRYRLYKLAGGEVAMHDDQGHQVHFKRDGIYVSAPNSKKIVGQIMDDDTMPQESGAKGGQIQQAGRPAAVNFTLDKHSFTLNHPTAINLNAPTITLTGTSIITEGNTFLGGADAFKKAGMKGTIDTNGDSLIDNLAKKVFLK